MKHFNAAVDFNENDGEDQRVSTVCLIFLSRSIFTVTKMRFGGGREEMLLLLKWMNVVCNKKKEEIHKKRWCTDILTFTALDIERV